MRSERHELDWNDQVRGSRFQSGAKLVMTPREPPRAVAPDGRGGEVRYVAIPMLVGKTYESASGTERCHLLEQLLRPLGALSLLAVANGVFASIRFRAGAQDVHVRLDDIRNVRGSDVIALVDYVQQISVEAVDGLAQMIAASPVLAGSAAAGLLMAMLVRRARTRAASASHDARKTDPGDLSVALAVRGRAVRFGAAPSTGRQR